MTTLPLDVEGRERGHKSEELLGEGGLEVETLGLVSVQVLLPPCFNLSTTLGSLAST